MSGLAFARAPALSHPLRFLACVPLWGIVAGSELLVAGGDLLRSPHAPATIALAHVFALGVLGNAMLGSLVQFLPVAAASPLPLRRTLPALHLAFNAGVALLLPAIALHSSPCAMLAVPLLAGSLATFAITTLVAVARGSGEAPLRAGIALAAVALLVTLGLGVGLLAMRSGWLAPAARSLTPLHAGFGLLGWVLGLLAAVGTMVMPMLQGTPVVPRAAQWAWLLLLVAVLAASILGLPAATARWLPVAPLLLFSAAVLLLQRRAPHQRNRQLRRFWWLGSVLLAAGALALATGQTLLAGVLVLAAGFPALVLGMLMEICSFLLWIDLRGRVPRGTRIPGVGRLFDEAGKHRAWWLHGVACTALAAACLMPEFTRVAGLLVVLAWLHVLLALWRSVRAAAAWRPDAPSS